MAAQPDSDRPAAEGRARPAGGNSPAERLSARSRRARLLLDTLLPVADALLLTAAFVLAYETRNLAGLFPIPQSPPSLRQYLPTLLLHVGTTMVIFYGSQLYHISRAVSAIDQIRRILGAVALGAVLAFGLQGLLLSQVSGGTEFDVDYPRSLFFYVWLYSTLLVELGRGLFRSLRVRLRRQGIDRENLLIVGAGRVAREITARIRGCADPGYNLVGVVTADGSSRSSVGGAKVIGSYGELGELIDRLGVEQVIIALPETRRSELTAIVNRCRRGRVDIKVYQDMFAYISGDLNVDELGGTPLLTVRDIALRGWKLSLKRGMDVLISFCGLVLLSPLLLLTALLVRLESNGTVFYIQERMGLDGQPFPMIKFRSMRADAEQDGPGWTMEDDPRRTGFGSVMRRSNWDEMPQLINVLLGHMSLVGPRPERPVYARRFREQIPGYMDRLREKAGMTGWAQVNGLRGDTSIVARTDYDLWYVENWSVWLDLRIIARTLWLILLRRERNAY